MVNTEENPMTDDHHEIGDTPTDEQDLSIRKKPNFKFCIFIDLNNTGLWYYTNSLMKNHTIFKP